MLAALCWRTASTADALAVAAACCGAAEGAPAKGAAIPADRTACPPHAQDESFPWEFCCRGELPTCGGPSPPTLERLLVFEEGAAVPPELGGHVGWSGEPVRLFDEFLSAVANFYGNLPLDARARQIWLLLERFAQSVQVLCPIALAFSRVLRAELAAAANLLHRSLPLAVSSDVFARRSSLLAAADAAAAAAADASDPDSNDVGGLGALALFQWARRSADLSDAIAAAVDGSTAGDERVAEFAHQSALLLTDGAGGEWSSSLCVPVGRSPYVQPFDEATAGGRADGAGAAAEQRRGAILERALLLSLDVLEIVGRETAAVGQSVEVLPRGRTLASLLRYGGLQGRFADGRIDPLEGSVELEVGVSEPEAFLAVAEAATELLARVGWLGCNICTPPEALKGPAPRLPGQVLRCRSLQDGASVTLELLRRPRRAAGARATCSAYGKGVPCPATADLGGDGDDADACPALPGFWARCQVGSGSSASLADDMTALADGWRQLEASGFASARQAWLEAPGCGRARAAALGRGVLCHDDVVGGGKVATEEGDVRLALEGHWLERHAMRWAPNTLCWTPGRLAAGFTPDSCCGSSGSTPWGCWDAVFSSAVCCAASEPPNGCADSVAAHVFSRGAVWSTDDALRDFHRWAAAELTAGGPQQRKGPAAGGWPLSEKEAGGPLPLRVLYPLLGEWPHADLKRRCPEVWLLWHLLDASDPQKRLDDLPRELATFHLEHYRTFTGLPSLLIGEADAARQVEELLSAGANLMNTTFRTTLGGTVQKLHATIGYGIVPLEITRPHSDRLEAPLPETNPHPCLAPSPPGAGAASLRVPCFLSCEGPDFDPEWAALLRALERNAAEGYPFDAELLQAATRLTSPLVRDEVAIIVGRSRWVSRLRHEFLADSHLQGFCLYGLVAALIIQARHLAEAEDNRLYQAVEFLWWAHELLSDCASSIFLEFSFLESSGWSVQAEDVVFNLAIQRLSPGSPMSFFRMTQGSLLDAAAASPFGGPGAVGAGGLVVGTPPTTRRAARWRLCGVGDHFAATLDTLLMVEASLVAEVREGATQRQILGRFCPRHAGQQHQCRQRCQLLGAGCDDAEDTEANDPVARWLDGVIHPETLDEVPFELAERRHTLAGIVASDARLAHADLLLCSHPTLLCILLADVSSVPVFVHASSTLLYGFPCTSGSGSLRLCGGNAVQDYLTGCRRLLLAAASGAGGRFTLLAEGRFLSEQISAQVGVEVPWAPPLAMYVRERRIGDPSRAVRSAVVLRSRFFLSFAGELLRSLLREVVSINGAPCDVHFLGTDNQFDEQWLSLRQIAGYDAAILYPNDLHQRTFHEVYTMGVPLFVPDSFGLYRMQRSSTWGYSSYAGALALDDAQMPRRAVPDREPWWNASDAAPNVVVDFLSLADWEQFPHIQRFASVPGLVAALLAADIRGLSEAMRAFHERLSHDVLAVVRAGVLRAVAGAADTVAAGG